MRTLKIKFSTGLVLLTLFTFSGALTSCAPKSSCGMTKRQAKKNHKRMKKGTQMFVF